MPRQNSRNFAAKNSTGTSSEGIRFSVWQSFMFSKLSPEHTISTPPTIETSAISASEMAELDIFAIR